MLKIEKEYQEKYGNIPSSDEERFEYVKSLGNYEKFKEEIDKLLNNQTEWGTLHYVFYILPKATPRPKMNTQTGIFYVRGAANNKKFFKEFIKDTAFDYVCTPCIFECKSYLPIPKSMKYPEKVAAEKGAIRPITIPDWDNLAKTYCDMIKGTILYDDRLIITGISSKYYSAKPRVEITIKYMKDFDSNYNKKLLHGKVDVHYG